MANPFKTIPIYVKLFVNRIEITRLDTNETASQKATTDFSNQRLVIADYEEAKKLLQTILFRLIHKKLIMPQLDIVIHQLAYIEGGISAVEKRILIDVAQRIGGKKVVVAQEPSPLSWTEARTKLKSK